ncbi:hypothetical protein [Paraburkholderia domus]|uniref:Uncharacterized protein n=1 Tax=Paraburkholderia domus TaxID=2793075 RepID=A0A9N8N708_9BURK|nr:hypothetical protein [Paraburkholderia domus]MBK5169462.1 hypothetical protein [Burkholderia sp. R-70211]CAE6959468.1 hypothetical protein R70211_06832 [Paraburkholderia domus]
MQAVYTSAQSSATSNNSVNSTPRREIFKLSDLDGEAMSDLKGMFGLWKETDHCDKDDR